MHFVISIHALRKESDQQVANCVADTSVFQSTLSVRRATSIGEGHGGELAFQSTLSVRRATRIIGFALPVGVISIHALRKESDLGRQDSSRRVDDFNPRSP